MSGRLPEFDPLRSSCGKCGRGFAAPRFRVIDQGPFRMSVMVHPECA